MIHVYQENIGSRLQVRHLQFKITGECKPPSSLSVMIKMCDDFVIGMWHVFSRRNLWTTSSVALFSPWIKHRLNSAHLSPQRSRKPVNDSIYSFFWQVGSHWIFTYTFHSLYVAINSWCVLPSFMMWVSHWVLSKPSFICDIMFLFSWLLSCPTFFV